LKQLTFSTAAGIENAEFTANDFVLEQNYPNPFNPSTKIRFDLKISQQVSLTIYNTTGEIVETLIDKKMLHQGDHSFEWKADKLSSGVYYFGLRSENGIKQIRKMTVLK